MASWLALPVSFFLGFIVTAQSTINREVATKRGILQATLANNSVVVLVNALLFLGALYWAKRSTDGGTVGHAPTGEAVPFWQWFVPGLFGLTFVLGVPTIIREFGALRVTLGVLAGQLAMSLIWDATKEGIALSPTRIGGVVLVAAGAWLASL